MLTVCSITMGTRFDEMAGGEDQSATSGRWTCRLAISNRGLVRIVLSSDDALFRTRVAAILFAGLRAQAYNAA